jgi:putative glutamine amidotransferase
MATKRPIIGCATYRKRVSQDNPIDVYGLMPSYTEALAAAGGIPLLIPLGLSEEDLCTIFERIDGLMIPGGGDVKPETYKGQWHDTLWGIDPERDRTEFFLIRTAIEQQKPMLAICRGIQVFNVAMGGTLWEDIPGLVPDAMKHNTPNGQPRNQLVHKVTVKPDSVLANALGAIECWVNSLHHQAIRKLAPGLESTATAPDGLIEAVEMTQHPFALGVQWHPENLVQDDPLMRSLFEGFVEAAAN